MSWFTDIATGPDNETHEPANYIALAGAVVGLGLESYVTIIKGQVFDLSSFGLGLGAIVGALGAAQRLRGDAK